MSPEPYNQFSLRREVERLLGMPPGTSDPEPGAVDPLKGIRRDARRFEEFLGKGLGDLRELVRRLRPPPPGFRRR